MFLEPFGKLFVGGPLHQRAGLDVAQLGLRLALELRVRQPHADDRRQALADVLSLEVVVVLLQQAALAGVAVHHRGEGTPEALLVHASLKGVDPVGEGMEAVAVEAGIPLEGDLHLLAFLLARDVAHLGEERFLGGVDMGHEIADAPLVAVADVLVALALAVVAETNLQTTVEEGHHLEAFRQRLEPEAGLLEDLAVRPEADRGTRTVVRRGADVRETRLEAPTVHEVHVVATTVPVDLDLDPTGKGVHHGDADPVQAT